VEENGIITTGPLQGGVWQGPKVQGVSKILPKIMFFGHNGLKN
jgi:hypothetical protein